MLTFALLLAAAADPAIDGSRLKPGKMCYAIVRGDQAIGATLQTVAEATHAGKPVWDVVVHQRVGDKFDLRDHFILNRADLTPISFDSRKSGVEHVRVNYGAGKIVTTRPGKPDVETKFADKIWDGNLWGLTFAAMPLKLGAHLELPFYQYDKGLGRFALDVTGSEKVAYQEAWVVETGEPGKKIRYFISQAGRAELGYAGSGFSQKVGGDCSGFAQ